MKKDYGPRMTIDKICDEGCINILKQFLRMLSREYAHNYLLLLKNPNDPDIHEHHNYLRDVFTSEYFNDLTNLDGRSIVNMIEENYQYVYDCTA